jgi:phage terminase small subunit
MKLTPKQQKFCEYYASNGNATESAKLSGYSAKTAESMGLENLRKPWIVAHLKILTQTDTDLRVSNAIERQQFLTAMMRGEIIDSDDYVKNTDRIKACCELGKLQGDYIERHQIESKNEITLRISRE